MSVQHGGLDAFEGGVGHRRRVDVVSGGGGGGGGGDGVHAITVAFTPATEFTRRAVAAPGANPRCTRSFKYLISDPTGDNTYTRGQRRGGGLTPVLAPPAPAIEKPHRTHRTSGHSCRVQRMSRAAIDRQSGRLTPALAPPAAQTPRRPPSLPRPGTAPVLRGATTLSPRRLVGGASAELLHEGDDGVDPASVCPEYIVMRTPPFTGWPKR